MIHVLRESSRAAVKRRRKLEEELELAGLSLGDRKSGQGTEEVEVEEGVRERLEGIGRVVGAQITEQYDIPSIYPKSNFLLVKD